MTNSLIVHGLGWGAVSLSATSGSRRKKNFLWKHLQGSGHNRPVEDGIDVSGSPVDEVQPAQPSVGVLGRSPRSLTRSTILQWENGDFDIAWMVAESLLHGWWLIWPEQITYLSEPKTAHLKMQILISVFSVCVCVCVCVCARSVVSNSLQPHGL